VLEEVARSVNLSETRLRALFRAETGTTPAQYLKSVRMRRVKELLGMTFLNVKQVMFEVSISDRRHFARDFRELYGHTPREYRKGVRG
jgi:transcriptional regulator GlxA family with amidase domain